MKDHTGDKTREKSQDEVGQTDSSTGRQDKDTRDSGQTGRKGGQATSTDGSLRYNETGMSEDMNDTSL